MTHHKNQSVADRRKSISDRRFKVRQVKIANVKLKFLSLSLSRSISIHRIGLSLLVLEFFQLLFNFLAEWEKELKFRKFGFLFWITKGLERFRFDHGEVGRESSQWISWGCSKILLFLATFRFELSSGKCWFHNWLCLWLQSDLMNVKQQRREKEKNKNVLILLDNHCRLYCLLFFCSSSWRLEGRYLWTLRGKFWQYFVGLFIQLCTYIFLIANVISVYC